MNLLCPLSSRPAKSSPPAPWLTETLHYHRRELRTAERRWRKSRVDSDLNSYKSLLSKFSLEVTSAKSSYYREKFESSSSDPHKLFTIFSSLLNPPPPSSSLTPEDFITFFEEKVAAVRQTFSSVPSPPANVHSPTSNSLTSFSPLSSDEILQLLTSSNPTTCPLDPIPFALFQTIARDLLPFISVIINNSLSSGYMPTAFNTARVVPILKKATLDSSSVTNYRLVSLLFPLKSP
ncbi:hypothetical protein P4O66_000781 [Electrophorus voltai]|uniref:Reverse transcriptase domain-containing protein n=1 Tax=Electrophorus voltai TaxID=2609070 RepID=A0AAD8ZEJ4_9TELE|nr:hypothetical protein P4O66_000781 [Electrophorus voltai]